MAKTELINICNVGFPPLGDRIVLETSKLIGF
jgi:hypothetical protein